MISIEHAEKLTTTLLWLGGLAAILCFPLWMAPLVLLAYVLLIGPWLALLLPVLVVIFIGSTNLVLWLFSRLTNTLPSNARRA